MTIRWRSASIYAHFHGMQNLFIHLVWFYVRSRYTNNRFHGSAGFLREHVLRWVLMKRSRLTTISMLTKVGLVPEINDDMLRAQARWLHVFEIQGISSLKLVLRTDVTTDVLGASLSHSKQSVSSRYNLHEVGGTLALGYFSTTSNTVWIADVAFGVDEIPGRTYSSPSGNPA